MERFSVDESGYTGADLLNEEQCWQGASAISISDDDASRLIKEHFPKLQAPELKYSSIARRTNYHEPLLRLLKDALQNYKAVTYVIDIRFVLAAQFLDYATEPFYKAQGIDFYQDGQHYAMSSVLYRTGPTFLGPDVYNGIMAAFQKAMREKTPESIGDLVERVRHSSVMTHFPEMFGPIATPSAECVRSIANPQASTDAAITLLMGLVNQMEVISAGPYRVEHDRSKNLLQYETVFQSFINNKEEKELKMTEIATLRFPLKLTQVAQVNSEDSPAVQVADVLVGSTVGAANAMSGKRTSQLDPLRVIGLYRHDQFIHLIPSTDFAEQKKFREGTQSGEAIDYVSKVVNEGPKPRK